jgi:hypothetical protein
MMQDVLGRKGRVACIGVLLTEQEGSQHQRAGTAREQENGISEALFYRGWTAASTTPFNTCDPKLSLVGRLRDFVWKIDAVIKHRYEKAQL